MATSKVRTSLYSFLFDKKTFSLLLYYLFLMGFCFALHESVMSATIFIMLIFFFVFAILFLFFPNYPSLFSSAFCCVISFSTSDILDFSEGQFGHFECGNWLSLYDDLKLG